MFGKAAGPQNINKRRDELEGAGRKVLLVPGLIINFIAIVLLLHSDQVSWTNSGRLYRFVS